MDLLAGNAERHCSTVTLAAPDDFYRRGQYGRDRTEQFGRNPEDADPHQPSVGLPTIGEPSTPWGEVISPARMARRRMALFAAPAGAPLSGSLAACRSGTVGMSGALGADTQMVASCDWRRDKATGYRVESRGASQGDDIKAPIFERL